MLRLPAFGLVVLWLSLVPATASAQIPTTFQNLQVLPKDISRAELVATMRKIAGALGVRCTHCHVGPDNLQGMDFATDARPAKQSARMMLRMVNGINAEYINGLPAREAPRQPVSCITCHRRSTIPPRPLNDLLLTTINASGTAAAAAEYRKLRASMLDSGLYDFREPTLNMVATALRDQKRFAEALDILKLNAEMFPASAGVQINLGDTAAQAGDAAAAAGFYTRALELEPGNAAALSGLERLKKE